MKTYKTLIKLSKQALDRKRRDLNILLEKKDELEKQRKILQEQLVKEGEVAPESMEAIFAYPAYAARVEVQQENILRFEKVLDEQADAMSEEIADAFAELKKYEIMLEKKIKKINDELSKKEQIQLDEIGGQKNNRGNSN